MNIALTVLETVAPVFLLAMIGVIWQRAGLAFPVPFVTRLAMSLAVPCLIFTALMKTQIAPAALATLSLASLAAYAAVGLASAVVIRVAALEFRTYWPPLTFGNTGNLGLPLALFAFGQEGLDLAVVVFAVMAILSFTIGVWIVAGGGAFTTMLKEPVVGATLLGALFLWQGWQTPVFLTNSLELVGQLAIPLMLILLGVAVSQLKPGLLTRSVVLSLIKAALCVGVAAGTGLAFGLAPTALAVLILQVSTPVAVTSYLLAEKYGAEAEAVAGLVVVSTCLSVALLPAILVFVL